jgi:exoribonuclease-2
VKMSTVAAPHQGLGVAQYMWSSSPLRRYVDMVNQRQIIAMLRDEEPAYPKNDPALYTTMRDFDTMYGIYNEFQRSMERYWCLRWLQQEKIEQVDAVILRENLVKVDGIPLIFRASSLPELPANTRVQLAIGEIDLLDLEVQTRFVAKLEEAIC